MFYDPYEAGRKRAEALLNSGLYELAEENRTGYVYGHHPFDIYLRRMHRIDRIKKWGIAALAIGAIAWLTFRNKSGKSGIWGFK